MKNNECVIYIMTKRGWSQTYKKNKRDCWSQNTNGTIRKMTAEQLLSHILPVLAAGNKRGSVISVKNLSKKKK